MNLKDYATSTVKVAPSPASSGLTLQVQNGHGDRFPDAPFWATAHPSAELPTLDNAEKILVTAKSTDTFTITRAQGDTTARNISKGWRISNALFLGNLPVDATFDTPGLVNKTIYNVRDYGATGNGVTNDKAAIQQAIDDANAAGGGIVYLPKGTYLVSSQVLLKSNVELVGQGKGQSILKSTASDFIVLGTTKTGTTKTVYENIAVRDLVIESSQGHCLIINNTTNVTVADCEFYFNVSSPVRESLVIQHGKYVAITRNYLHDLTGNGVQVNACDYFTVANNLIEGNAHCDDGIDIDKDFLDTGQIQSNHGSVTGNIINGSTRGNGIRIAASNFITVSANEVSNVSTDGGAGILVNSYTAAVYDSLKHVVVSNNIVSNCLTDGIRVSSDGGGGTAEDVLIANNTLEACGQTGGTNLRGGINVTVSGIHIIGNHLDTCGKSGGDGAAILFYKSNNHFISNNSIANSPTGIRAWNGDAASTYTGVTITNNKMISNSANYSSDVFSQSGIKVMTVSANGFGFGKDAATTLVDLAGTLNATGYQLNGTDINTAGTLTNVAYKNQVNTFTAQQIIQGTALASNEAGVLSVRGTTTTAKRLNMAYDEVNDYSWIQSVHNGVSKKALYLDASRVGIAKVPAAGFILDVNGAMQVAGKISNVTDPTAAQDAATKNYVDVSAPALNNRVVTKTVAPTGTTADYNTDGTADNVEIQAAIDAVNAAGGGEVRLRTGTYTLAAIVNLKAGVSLVGEGWDNTKIVQSSNYTLKISGISRVRIAHLRLDASAMTAGNTFGIYAENCTDVSIDHNYVENAAGFGIFVTANSTNISRNIWVTDNYVSGKGTSDVIGGGNAVDTALVRDVFVHRNHVIQDASVGSNHQDAINFVGVYRIHFTENVVEGSVLFGAEKAPHKYSIITNNTIKKANGANRASLGLIIDGALTASGEACVLANNAIENGFIDVYCNPASLTFNNLIVSGNTINADGVSTGLGEAGIVLAGASGAVITGNSVFGSDGDGIWLRRSTNCQVTGNVIRDSAGYAYKEDNSSDNNHITGNSFVNNTSGTINGTGSNDIIHSNKGDARGVPVAYGGTGSTTASGARTNLGVAAAGANSDITSLSGLTTPLSIAQGGTGSATQNFIDLTNSQIAAGQKTFSSTTIFSNTTTGIDSYGNDNFFGTGRTDGTKSYIDIGNLGDTSNVWLDARGNPADVSMKFRTKGTGTFQFVNGSMDLGSHKITSVSDPTSAQDVATKNYVDTTGLKVYNVKSSTYGAVGDGTTNDGPAINSAITAANTAGGGIVYLPAATYATATRIVPKSNVTVMGAGKGVTIIKGSVASDYTFYNTSAISNFTLTDLTIDINNVSSASGWRLNAATNCLVQRVETKNGPTNGWLGHLGVFTSATDGVLNLNNKIVDCDFDTHAGSLEMLLIYNARNTQIIRPRFTNKTTGPVLGLWQKCYGTYIEDIEGTQLGASLLYFSVTVEDTTINGMYGYNVHSLITGANTSDNGNFGLTQAQGLKIVNPTAIAGTEGSEGTGIKIGSVNDVTIINPHLSGFAVGINVSQGNSGNTTAATNWSIIGGEITNGNPDNNVHALHPGILIDSVGGSQYGLIDGVKIYDSRGTQFQRYPIVFDGAFTFDQVQIVNNRLSADVANSGTSIRLQDSAALGSNVFIANNQDYSGTSPSQLVLANATTSVKGQVQLTNDLGGTATAPTVVATHLASALPINQGGTGSTTQNFVDLSNTQTVAGAKTFSNTITASSKLQFGALSAGTDESIRADKGIKATQTGTNKVAYLDDDNHTWEGVGNGGWRFRNAWNHSNAYFAWLTGDGVINGGTVAEVMRLKSDGTLGIGTTAPTHTLTLPSTSSGIAIYNTSDQTTNYERVTIKYVTNVAVLGVETGGTGIVRDVQLRSTRSDGAYSYLTVTRGSLPLAKIGNDANISSTGSFFQVQHLFNASSGIQVSTSITPTITQTSTGGYTALLINPTESSTGSGTKLLLDLQVGSSSKFSISNTGKIITTLAQTYTATNVTTDRSYDANATTTDELADVLGTLIGDLRAVGVVL